ncbi:MAG: Gldg family protein [Polyangiales bacterium]
MSDDTKKPDETKGESDESVTKIEKRRSDLPDAPKSEPPKSEPAKAEAKSEEKTEEKAEEKPAAKKALAESDDSPTAAHTPIAKKAGDEPKPKAKAKPAAKDEDEEEEKPAVRRPPPVAKAADTSAGESRRARASGESAGLLAIGLGILVVGNLAMQSVSRFRFDATKEERFTLSKKGTGHLLSTLTKPLSIEVFIPKGLATTEAFERDLRDLLDEYKRLSDGKVTYVMTDPNSLEGEEKTKAEAKAQEAGLRKQILGEAKGAGAKQATIGEGYLGMIMSYGGERVTVDQQDGLDERNPQGLEFLISNKIREIRDKEDKIVHKIGYLQGHKEKGFQELSQIFGKYFPYYKFEAVDLSKGEKDVDDSLDGLIMTSPEEEISTKELRRIDKFLMKGKALAVFANNVHLKDADPSMNATFTAMGIEKLLTGYGIDFKNELVVDKTNFWTPVLQGPQGIGIQLDPYPLIFVTEPGRGEGQFDNKFAPFFRLPQLAVPFPTEITVDQARAGGSGVTVNPVLKTSPQIITVQGTSVSLNPGREKLGNGASGQKEEKRQAILAVDIEGSIKSAFLAAGEGVEGVPPTSTAKARLFVVSAGAYFGNPFQDAGKSPFGGMMPGMDPNMGADEELMRYAQIYNRIRMPSFIVAKQTCDWISQETDLLAVGAKLMGEPELTYPHSPAPTPAADEKIDSESFRKKKLAWIDSVKSAQRFTQWFNILAGPLLVGLFGLFRWWNRGTRRAAVKI